MAHSGGCCRWGNGLEFDQNEPRQRLCNWLDKAGGCTLFDFVTKGIVSEAVRNCEYWRLRDSNGQQPGLVGWWPSRAVTFLDNHDTGAADYTLQALPAWQILPYSNAAGVA